MTTNSEVEMVVMQEAIQLLFRDRMKTAGADFMVQLKAAYDRCLATGAPAEIVAEAWGKTTGTHVSSEPD